MLLATFQPAGAGAPLAGEIRDGIGKAGNPFNLAAANRADVLLKAPMLPAGVRSATYALCIVKDIGIQGFPPAPLVGAEPPTTLLTVNVTGPAVDMAFITNKADFPKPPKFLDDVPTASLRVCDDPRGRGRLLRTVGRRGFHSRQRACVRVTSRERLTKNSTIEGNLA